MDVLESPQGWSSPETACYTLGLHAKEATCKYLPTLPLSNRVYNPHIKWEAERHVLDLSLKYDDDLSHNAGDLVICVGCGVSWG